MRACHDPADALRVQQDWLSGVLTRAAEDLTALSHGMTALARSARGEAESAAPRPATGRRTAPRTAE